MEHVILNYQKLHHDSIILSNKLKLSGKSFERIIAIARGGLFPALIVSQVLNIKDVHTIIVSGYTDDVDTGSRKVHYTFDDFMIHDHSYTLVIDDLSDTGKTLKEIQDLLPNCTYATLYVKPEGQEYPDFYVDKYEQDTWIEFAWEK